MNLNSIVKILFEKIIQRNSQYQSLVKYLMTIQIVQLRTKLRANIMILKMISLLSKDIMKIEREIEKENVSFLPLKCHNQF